MSNLYRRNDHYDLTCPVTLLQVLVRVLVSYFPIPGLGGWRIQSYTGQNCEYPTQDGPDGLAPGHCHMTLLILNYYTLT